MAKHYTLDNFLFVVYNGVFGGLYSMAFLILSEASETASGCGDIGWPAAFALAVAAVAYAYILTHM